MASSNKQKVISLLQAIGSGDPEALSFVSRAVVDSGATDGSAAHTGWLSGHARPAKIEVVRAFEDGDYVFTHSLYSYDEPSVVFDIFRFEDGIAVEHWSNAQPFAKPNPSGHTLIDGATELADLDRTKDNKALVREFVTEHLIRGSADIARFFDGDDYIQHNPNIRDKVSGLLSSGEAFRKQGLSIKITGIDHVLGQGNFVLVLSEGYFGEDHLSFYDLYRVQNARIAEHWDVLEKVHTQ